MRDMTDLLTALGDVGVAGPGVGDIGDGRVRAALEREITGRRRFRQRVRLPFGRRSIALMPTALLVTVTATAAAAGTVALFHVDPIIRVFDSSASTWTGPGLPTTETVIRSTVRMIDTIQVPGVGSLQYWVAQTAEHGVCQAFRRSDGSWAGHPPNGAGGGMADAASTRLAVCGATREQLVALQGNGPGLMPMSVGEQSISQRDTTGRWWDIYYGLVTANGASGVEDLTSGQTVPVIDGHYFVMVSRQQGRCSGCDSLRAVDASGRILPANYGPVHYRNH
jgi:hypothetical protein